MQIISSKKLAFRKYDGTKATEELFTTTPPTTGRFAADAAEEAPDWIKNDPYFEQCVKSGWIVDFADKSKLVETPQGFVHKDIVESEGVPMDQADKAPEQNKKADKAPEQKG